MDCVTRANRDYVTRANIQRFETMLAGDLDPDKRRILEGLLAEQKTELKAIAAQEAR